LGIFSSVTGIAVLAGPVVGGAVFAVQPVQNHAPKIEIRR
jgi:hypothetical protein